MTLSTLDAAAAVTSSVASVALPVAASMSASSASPLRATEPWTLVGTVLEVEAGVCLISTEGHVLEARRAVSCLIEVQAQDRVCLLLEPDGQAHVLSVLTRVAGAPLTIPAPDGLQIHAGPQADIELRSGGLRAVAERGHWLVGSLKVVLGELQGESRAVRWVSKVSHAIVDSLHVVAQRSYRHVSGSDHQRSAYLDIEAEQLAQIRARSTMITSSQLTRVDGSQIHVG